MSDPIRWLHLSDFHVGKDDWAQRRLFEKIIEHVADQKGKGFIPDVVFITGDIANAGQKSQYTEFRRGFLVPVLDALGGTDLARNAICRPWKSRRRSRQEPQSGPRVGKFFR